jgi:hypothetical protein
MYNDKTLEEIDFTEGKEVINSLSFLFNKDLNFNQEPAKIIHFEEVAITAPPSLPMVVETDPPKPIRRKTIDKHESNFNPNLEYDHEIVETACESFSTPKVIEMPSPRPSKLKNKLSRIERARLLNAGFEICLTENGEPPINLQLNDADISKLKSNLDIERIDPLLNDMNITFLGVSFDDTLFEIMAGKVLFI